jgi:hypothetical protein
MTSRLVHMTSEQAAEIEVYIETLMRAGHTDRAATMMNLSLAWRFAPVNEPELPSNVYPIVRHAGDSWSRKVVS